MYMRVALICIVRNENPYLREFIAHYLELGFHKIFICDNGQLNEPSPLDVIAEFAPRVEVLNYRNKPHPQNLAYTECYARYKTKFDWLAFFDCDEFLILKHDKKITTYLTRFPKTAQLITFNWQTMTDNGLLRYENKPLMQRFTQPMEKYKQVQFNFPENYHVKCIVKGNLPSITWKEPHNPSEKLIAYHSNLRPEKQGGHHKIDYSFAMLRHFPTKTIEEWCKNKVPRRRVHNGGEYEPVRFFKYNEKTPEKVAILKSFYPEAQV